MSAGSKKSEDTTKKLHRLLTILRLLDNRERCTPETLAGRLCTTERNIYRDLRNLDTSGFAIAFNRDNNTYGFTDPDFSLRDLNLNKEELLALLVGRQVAHGLGRPFDKAFQSILRKVHRDTGSKTREKVLKMEERQQFMVDITPVEGFEQIERQYNAVTEAMDGKEEIEIVYRAMKNERETKRDVAP